MKRLEVIEEKKPASSGKPQTLIPKPRTPNGRYKATLANGEWTAEKESVALVPTLQANPVSERVCVRERESV